MKNKILVLVMLVAIGLPQVVSAAWWNPFSWFRSSVSEIKTEISTPSAKSEKTNTFYVKVDGARIRSCPGTSCQILGYYNQTSWIKVPESDGGSLNSLPDWLSVTTEDGVVGYISKSVLSETPFSRPTNTQPSSGQPSIEAITRQKIDLISNFNRAVIDADHELNKAIISVEVSLETQESIKNRLELSPYDNHQQIAEVVSSVMEELESQLNEFNESKRSLASFSQAARTAITNSQAAITQEEIDALFKTVNYVSKEANNALTEFENDYEEYEEALLAALDPGSPPPTYVAPPLTYYQPRVIPQLTMPKTIYCTTKMEFGNHYSTICN